MNERQQKAVDANGLVIVRASAGTGKTHTLIQRCLRLIREGASLDRMLLVTFTEAAAGELRNRIRIALDEGFRQSGETRFREQQALVDYASIGTIHALCREMLRDHFDSLGLDPNIQILEASLTRQLQNESLKEAFNLALHKDHPKNTSVRDFIRTYCDGSLPTAQSWLLRLYNFVCAYPNPDDWINEQREAHSNYESSHWSSWFAVAVSQWHKNALLRIGSKELEHPTYRLIQSQLQTFSESDSASLKDLLHSVAGLRGKDYWPRGTAPERDRHRPIFTEAEFLASQLEEDEGSSRLKQTFKGVQPAILALLDLLSLFRKSFIAKKKQAGGLDFNDLEHQTINLLFAPKGESSTEISELIRDRYDHVFVDEYQDVNRAQNAIIEAISSVSEGKTRFIVGDGKQSIYRFRQANPDIFNRCHESWKAPDTSIHVIALKQNYRSHPKLLGFANDLFQTLEAAGASGLDYDHEAAFAIVSEGDDEGSESPCEIALHVLMPPEKGAAPDDEKALAVLTPEEREVTHIANPLQGLKTSNPNLKWAEIAILIRSPKGRLDAFRQIFESYNIPLRCPHGDLDYDEVSADITSLLTILDNPYRDIPLATALTSPFGGLLPDDLIHLRSLSKTGPLWLAMNRALEDSNSLPARTRERTRHFLDRYHAWRECLRDQTITAMLETALNDSDYIHLMSSLRGDSQTLASINRLFHQAEEYDRRVGQGLGNFLTYLDSSSDSGPEEDALSPGSQEAVTLLSIHKSKGLEFDTVVLASLGQKFNQSDSIGRLVLSNKYGLTAAVAESPDSPLYDSLPSFLASKEEKEQTRHEELRLLYVAITRAKRRLIMVGSSNSCSEAESWDDRLSTDDVVLAEGNASKPLDWIRLWYRLRPQSKRSKILKFSLIEEVENTQPGLKTGQSGVRQIPLWPIEQATHAVENQLDYAYQSSTTQIAKASVSALLSQRSEPLVQRRTTLERGWEEGNETILTGKERGNAHHIFLQFLDLKQTSTLLDLQREAERMRLLGILSEEQIQSLNFSALASFWQSELGQDLSKQGPQVNREMPFTARFTRTELVNLKIPIDDSLEDSEYVTVQGIVDLVIVFEEAIWIVDFKTDQLVTEEAMNERAQAYRPQLELYRSALSRLFQKPVQKAVLYFLNSQPPVEVLC